MSHANELICTPRISLEPARFLSARQQRKLARSVDLLPRDICCPECQHSYDIVISRQQISKGRISRLLFRYMRCRVCEHRFSQVRSDVFHKATRIGLATTAFVFLVVAPAWLT